MSNPDHLNNPLARLAATVVEPLYTGVIGLRNFGYNCGFLPTRRAPMPVISVGNLTAGGTGKTPIVIDVVRRLQSLGATPGVILRGYHADSEGRSDEALVYETALPFVPVVTGGNRLAAAHAMHRDHSQVNIVVLDDAFQHRRIARELDLVLIDATNPFGHDAVLPRGLMREAPAGLRRADAVIVTRSDQVDKHTLAAIDRRIEVTAGRPPIAHAVHAWVGFVDEQAQAIDPGHRRVTIMCGLGNPQAFIQQARDRFIIEQQRVFADHHDYTAADVSDLPKCDAVLTTDKDYVKLRRLLESQPLSVPVWRPKLEIRWLDGEAAVADRLAAVVECDRQSSRT